MDPPSPSSAVRPLRRRNGRPQACEPCRKRKVACDHQYPVCARCMRAGIRERCSYVVQGPSPIGAARARHGSPLSPAPSTSSSRAGSAARHSPAITAANAGAARGLLSSAAAAAGAGPRSEAALLPPAVPDADPGFLGATSFSALFTDTLQRPAIAAAVNGQHPTTIAELRTQVVSELSSVPAAVDHASLEQALEILREIPTKEECGILMHQYSCMHLGWSQLAATRLIESLWETYGEHLASRPDERLLGAMAQAIRSNSSVPLAESHADPRDWFQAFAGPGLRWESLGILFIAWGSGAMTLSGYPVTEAHKRIFDSGTRNLLVKHKTNAWRCAEMCRAQGNRNSLLAYLLYRHSLLQSMVSGDASWEFWRLHSEAVSLITFLGFHEAAKTSPTGRSISSQMKRRIFSGIFTNDKLVASFSGRPPLLSRNYLDAAMPLDINDEILLSMNCSGATDAELRIDENGWNIDGQVYPTTVLRARAMLAYIRDAILEVALPASKDSQETTLLNLLEAEMRVVEQFPAALILQDGDVKNTLVDGDILFTRLLMRLEHLQNLFFIERLLSRGATGTVSRQLLVLSLEMVSLTLAFWTHQNRLYGRVGDFEWLVMCYAAPAGGILCTELLNPSSSRAGGDPSATASASASTTMTSTPTTPMAVTRSSIIQQLSLLFGFLDWVGPTAPNGDLCSSVKQVIKHVLDEALNVSADAPGLMDEVGNWDMGFSGDLNEYFSFDLLDTFDWLRTERN